MNKTHKKRGHNTNFRGHNRISGFLKRGHNPKFCFAKLGCVPRKPETSDCVPSFKKKLVLCPPFFKKISIMSPFLGIAGCGGLGSNCAANLVRAGFKKFMLVDFDKVERSNLNRQFYFYNQMGRPKVKALAENLKKIEPNLKIDAIKIKLNARNIKKTFEDCDIIVEGFDKASLKKLIAEKIIPTGKLLVSASGICGIGNSDDIKVHRLKPNLILVGDLKTCSTKTPPISPRINIAAAKQADAILEYVLKKRGTQY